MNDGPGKCVVTTHRSAIFWGMVLAVAGTFSGCANGSAATFTRLMQARELGAELSVRVVKSADASNRAVMADTDEASIAFAHEAEQETEAVQNELDRLATLLRSLDYADELALLAEFRAAFAQYRTLDHEVLALAVENTNLKAQRMSFGASHQAADTMRDTLEAAIGSTAMQGNWQARSLVLTAIVAVREIEILQGPHIAASEDALMTQLEQQMAASEDKARRALRDAAQLKAELKPALDAAGAALTRFMAINSQIVTLSRRNSNVRSLALALGRKRTLTAACEGSLRALSARLAKHDFPATR
jgi:hypothetical protein